MFILAKESTENAEQYKPSEENEVFWNSFENRFMGDHFVPQRAINQIIETANIMAFE